MLNFSQQLHRRVVAAVHQEAPELAENLRRNGYIKKLIVGEELFRLHGMERNHRNANGVAVDRDGLVYLRRLGITKSPSDRRPLSESASVRYYQAEPEQAALALFLHLRGCLSAPRRTRQSRAGNENIYREVPRTTGDEPTMRADTAKLREISEQLKAAQTQPDYEATYRRLAEEARIACGDEPEQQDYIEFLIPYTPTETGEAPLPLRWA